MYVLLFALLPRILRLGSILTNSLVRVILVPNEALDWAVVPLKLISDIILCDAPYLLILAAQVDTQQYVLLLSVSNVGGVDEPSSEANSLSVLVLIATFFIIGIIVLEVNVKLVDGNQHRHDLSLCGITPIFVKLVNFRVGPGDEKDGIDGWIFTIDPCSLHKILETEFINKLGILIECLLVSR